MKREQHNTKQRPILFSTPMVQAILEGRKTQTRRVIKPQPVKKGAFWEYGGAGWSNQIKTIHPVIGHSLYYACPYGKPKDVLWVKETWQHTKILNVNPLDENYAYVYKASKDGIEFQNNIEYWTWKPSLFMPKEAARIFLRITSVHVERLQEISEDDAKAEGITEYAYGYWKNYLTSFCGGRPNTTLDFKNPIESFKSLWQSINGEQSWNDNPYVWVIEFERI